MGRVLIISIRELVGYLQLRKKKSTESQSRQNAVVIIFVTATITSLAIGTMASGPCFFRCARNSLCPITRSSSSDDSSFGQKASGAQGGILQIGDRELGADLNPFVFTVGADAPGAGAVAGLDEAVRGMRKGQVRRVVVPCARAYTLPLDRSRGPVPDDFGQRRQIERELAKADPSNYFFFEVQLTNLR